MNVFVKIQVWVAAVVYYVGIVTGWWSQHPSKEWYNPDAVIHTSLFLILPVMIGDLIRKRRRRFTGFDEIPSK